MNHIVTVIDLKDGVVTETFGPFDSAAVAMDFADKESLLFTGEHPGFVRESSDEIILVSMQLNDEEIDGKVWQVHELLTPATVIDDGGSEQSGPLQTS